MNPRIKMERKTYAMWRMVEALGRAIRATAPADKTRAARWVAAWGVLGGIRSPGVRLRRDALAGEPRRPRRHPA